MAPDTINQTFTELDEAPIFREDEWKTLKILLLADNRHLASVVRDHIGAFLAYSRHDIEVANPIHENPPSWHRLSQFDGILIHYSIYILGDYFLPEKWRVLIEHFDGCKAQIIQDEYRLIDAMKERMAKLGVSAIFSSLEPHNTKKVYGDHTLPGISVISCLPGYIADNFYTISGPPIAERPLDVIYRGRSLLPMLGLDAHRKQRIGEQVLGLAHSHGLKVDISSEEESRIYGDDWIRFLTSGRATLGVEGGASIFDFDGEVAQLVSEYKQMNPEADFFAVWDAVLRPYEGNIVHRTLTPRIFEAIAAKTALVLYPGNYRGVLIPGRHYIKLEEDASNIEAVIEQIKDSEKLQEMVDLSYEEILHQERLTFQHFVRKVDHVLLDCNRKKPRNIKKMLHNLFATTRDKFYCLRGHT
jgi:hypothetical protein